MIINNNEFVTEIKELSSLEELISAKDRLGSTALLIVHLNDDLKLCSGAEEFFRSADYMTAAACENGKEVPEELKSLFDLIIPAETTAEYTKKLFKDKSAKQVSEITACFVAARKGASVQELLDCESRAFYRLIADKTGGVQNG